MEPPGVAASHNCCRKLVKIDIIKSTSTKWVKWKRGSILSIFVTTSKESRNGMIIKKVLVKKDITRSSNLIAMKTKQEI